MEPEFNLESTLRSTNDSVYVINQLVNEGTHTQDIHDTIKRNTDHIKMMLSDERVISSNSPFIVDFENAVVLGEEFISFPIE